MDDSSKHAGGSRNKAVDTGLSSSKRVGGGSKRREKCGARSGVATSGVTSHFSVDNCQQASADNKSESKMKKSLALLTHSRRTRSSEKSNPQIFTCSNNTNPSSEPTPDADVDLSTLYSGCVTRGQINRVKKIIGECSPSHVTDMSPMNTRSSKRLASDQNHNEKMQVDDSSTSSAQRKIKSLMKRKHDALSEVPKSPEKKACRVLGHSSSSLDSPKSPPERRCITRNSVYARAVHSPPHTEQHQPSSPGPSHDAVEVLTAPPTPTLALPEGTDDWLRRFLKWNAKDKIQALENLIGVCQPHEVRHMLEIIEPQFQRDFISLLPKELALHVLSFLEPRDLLIAAQTCRYWRILTEDNLMWREKCKEEGISEPYVAKVLKHNWRNKKSFSAGTKSTWKAAFLRHVRIETNWREGKERISKVLKGHDDHVITCLQFNGSRIVSGSDDNTLKVWSAISGKCLRTLTGHTGGVWASQMRKNLIISGSTDRTLKIWNADTGNCVHTLYGHTSTVRCLALHDNIVVSGSRDATLRVWNIEDGECLHVLVGHMAAVRCVCYDGRRVVSGAYDYMVKVWDPVTEECLHTLQGHTNRVYSLQFDGTYVVSGSLDTSIRVWELETGTCLHTLMGHQSLTSGMVLRGNILVSGNADSTVKVWDILTGECLKTLEGSNKHLSAVTCLQFRGKFIITSSDDGTVKLWDIETGKVIRDLVTLESRGSGGVVWRIRASQTKLVCAFGSRNGTEETKLMVLDFDPDSK
uniref:F-box/WD repeat-containing protein 7 n=1 Tax=Phallusia mammillata TaxID=59560 RepID=A0A6F9DC33_9ASCI|nr:F-box/WD repeat-containing protein 7 [Phallusia mammillata]